MNANASTVKYTLHLSILHPNMAEEYPVFSLCICICVCIVTVHTCEMQTQLAERQVYAPTQKLGA